MKKKMLLLHNCAHVLVGSHKLSDDLIVEKMKCPELDIGFFKMDMANVY